MKTNHRGDTEINTRGVLSLPHFSINYSFYNETLNEKVCNNRISKGRSQTSGLAVLKLIVGGWFDPWLLQSVCRCVLRQDT